MKSLCISLLTMEWRGEGISVCGICFFCGICFCFLWDLFFLFVCFFLCCLFAQRAWDPSIAAFRLVKSTTPEVVGNNHICHRVENKLNVLCISGTGHVTVDLLRRWLVLRLKLGLDVRSSLPVFLCACIFCEADCERRSEDFLLKEILLVEEQDDGGVSEPLVVADGVEQF